MLNGPMKLGVALPDGIAAYFEALQREPSIAQELETYRPALAAWVESVTGSPA